MDKKKRISVICFIALLVALSSFFICYSILDEQLSRRLKEQNDDSELLVTPRTWQTYYTAEQHREIIYKNLEINGQLYYHDVFITVVYSFDEQPEYYLIYYKHKNSDSQRKFELIYVENDEYYMCYSSSGYTYDNCGIWGAQNVKLYYKDRDAVFAYKDLNTDIMYEIVYDKDTRSYSFNPMEKEYYQTLIRPSKNEVLFKWRF